MSVYLSVSVKCVLGNIFVELSSLSLNNDKFGLIVRKIETRCLLGSIKSGFY